MTGILTFFYEKVGEFDLKIWTFSIRILFIFLFYNMMKSANLLYGYKNKMNFWVIISILLLIIAPYSLAITYPALMWKSKYYSIENIYAQSLAFFFLFINEESMFYFDGGAKAFVIMNALLLFSAGFEKLDSKIWRSGNAAKGFLSLPYLIKPFFYPGILKISKVANLIVPLEFLFLLALLSNVSSTIFMIGIIAFGITLFTILDISFIGQLLIISMLGCFIIWPKYNFSDFDFSIENIAVFSILSLSLINLTYPNKILLNIMKISTGAVSPIKVFTELHQTGLFTYKFKKRGEDILMAFDENGLFHKSQLFTSRYNQSAMYKITDYCLGKKNEDEIADLAYQAAKGETVILCVKPYDSDKGYKHYKNSKWHNIAEISFDNDTYKIIKLKNPPEIKTLREI
ncbi:MAG: hypothetical protein CMD29_02190 [Flavobacteriales bacterium]|nr:hypothetical protein [Flavobacteriales bacterium]